MDEAARSVRWQPRNPDYERVVRETFDCQNAMKLIGASVAAVAPGFVEIRLPFSDQITQQHKVLHGGVVGMVLDSACAFATLTLLPPDATGFTVEYKVNLLEPARGEELVARGHVTKPGRTLTVTSGEAFAVSGGEERLVAVALETVFHFQQRPDEAPAG